MFHAPPCSYHCGIRRCCFLCVFIDRITQQRCFSLKGFVFLPGSLWLGSKCPLNWFYPPFLSQMFYFPLFGWIVLETGLRFPISSLQSEVILNSRHTKTNKLISRTLSGNNNLFPGLFSVFFPKVCNTCSNKKLFLVNFEKAVHCLSATARSNHVPSIHLSLVVSIQQC